MRRTEQVMKFSATMPLTIEESWIVRGIACRPSERWTVVRILARPDGSGKKGAALIAIEQLGAA